MNFYDSTFTYIVYEGPFTYLSFLGWFLAGLWNDFEWILYPIFYCLYLDS